MKKVYALCLMATFALDAAAQETPGSKFQGGLRVTPIFMWLKADVDDPTKFSVTNDGVKAGFAYGVIGDYFFAQNYGISTELRIAHLGAAYTRTNAFYVNDTGGQVSDVNLSRDFSLQYIEIPVSLKMRTNEVGYMRYFGQFGFVPAINIKAKEDQTYTKGGQTLKEVAGRNASKDVNTFGAYLLIGAGAEYNLGGTTSILGGISFHNGFSNLVDAANKTGYSVKPAYIAINLGVMF